LIEQLKKYVEENDLHNKAIDNFWITFDNWKKDYPENYAKLFDNISIDDLNVFVHSIGLRSSQWPECDYNHVIISILVYYNDRSLGGYRYFFSLSDNVDDDDIWEIG
jgi:Zn/Cd-binding protein ZinT